MNPKEERTIPRATLPRKERLTGRTAVETLFRDGKSGFVYPFRYILSVEPAGDGSGQAPVRILFSVPKRYHKRANKRNLLKRRSREAYRQAKFPLTEAALRGSKRLKLALVYSSKDVEDYARIENALRRIISEIRGRL
ncbi:MAG: ribonuclease P protein component [Rikenellaceae bacterium]|nr:ribonuclease P protein component [Rikenellaceae bacterium]